VVYNYLKAKLLSTKPIIALYFSFVSHQKSSFIGANAEGKPGMGRKRRKKRVVLTGLAGIKENAVRVSHTAFQMLCAAMKIRISNPFIVHRNLEAIY
jgi:hypothetical protein